MVDLPKGLDYHQPADFFSKMAAHYENGFSGNPRLVAFVELFAKLLPKHARVLDAGCGTGRPVAETLDRYGFGVTGIDVASGMLEMCRRAVPNASLELVDYTTYTPIERFDGVIHSLSLFGLSPDALRGMGQRWSQWLKEGGIVAMVNLVADEIDYNGSAEGGRFMGHRVVTPLLTKQEWVDIFKQNGFEIIESSLYRYQAPDEYESDPERHFCVVARKNQ